MNGQLGSPEIAATPPPRSPRAAAVTGRGAAGSRSKQTLKRRPSPWGRGVLPPDPGVGREPQSVQDRPPSEAGERPHPGMGADLSVPWAVRTGTRAPGGPCPDFTSFFTFHSSFSLTASSALPILRRLTRGRCPAAPYAPHAPSPPPRLSAQRPTHQAEPPPAALPASCSATPGEEPPDPWRLRVAAAPPHGGAGKSARNPEELPRRAQGLTLGGGRGLGGPSSPPSNHLPPPPNRGSLGWVLRCAPL